MDVAAWLRSLRLEQYEQAFRDNAVDAAVLPELTVEDLRDLGVSLVGHRRKLLAAIAVLRSDVGSTASAPVATSTAERRQLTVMFCDLVGSTPYPCGSIPRICAGSSARITAPSPRRSKVSAGLLRAIWATASSSISDIRRRTGKTPSAPYDAVWRRSTACPS